MLNLKNKHIKKKKDNEYYCIDCKIIWKDEEISYCLNCNKIYQYVFVKIPLYKFICVSCNYHWSDESVTSICLKCNKKKKCLMRAEFCCNFCNTKWKKINHKNNRGVCNKCNKSVKCKVLPFVFYKKFNFIYSF